jgi:SNF2 family DNA or RNA helicase
LNIRQLFLISLKAGGFGLNLTGADVVIHYDPWWNPAVENQATDRAHRIGQKKTVHVIRLVAKGTIEDKILSLQDKKQALVDSILEAGDSVPNRLDLEEILELLQTE